MTTKSSLKQWAVIIAWIGGSLLLYVSSTLVAALLTRSAVAAAAIGALAIFAFVAWWRWKSKAAGEPVLPAQQRGAFALAALGAVAGMLLCTQVMSLFVRMNLDSIGFEQVLAAQSQAPVWLLLISALVLAPVGEEALIRGMAYPLLRRAWPPLASAFVTSMIFALLHGNLAQIVLTFPLGMLLAYIYEITQRLWVPILAHMAFNVGSVLIPPAWIELMTSPATAVAAGMAATLIVLLMRETLVRARPEEGLSEGAS